MESQSKIPALKRCIKELIANFLIQSEVVEMVRIKSVLSPRLLIKVVFSRCAPMYGKCLLYWTVKSINDVTVSRGKCKVL